jgi:anti-sigma factor RsiW
MSHPGPLLTDFVDGTLGKAERADVEQHLETCVTCSDEVALARAARSALRALPVATTPPGLADGVIAEATRPTQIDASGPRAKASTTRRWLAAAAVAAAVALLAVAAPKLGSAPSQMAAGSEGAADRSFAKAAGVEVVAANVSQAQLATVAAALGGIQPVEAAPTSGSVGATAQPRDLQAGQVLPAKLPQAAACLDQAFGDTPGTLTRVLQARFEGTPAYFGLYAVGPGADLAPTRVQLLVASVRGCDVLASAYASL